MDLATHRALIETIGHGKRLPGALYLCRGATLNGTLAQMAARAEAAARPDPNWNLLKLHTDQVAVTFLSYPHFDADPHPALAESTKINLNTGSVTRTDYRARANPPILHRKETFLAPDDPRAAVFAALTRQEEEAGLYRDPSRIGLRIQWQTLLKRLRLKHEGHTLVSLPPVPVESASPEPPEGSPQSSRRARNAETRQNEADTDSDCNGAVESISDAGAENDGSEPEIVRHRTAIKRYDLSKPVKQLLERGLLRKGDTFFDYGCGHGMDIEALQNLGYTASGWDPAFRPNAAKESADVVNLGYVLNVIEDPAERLEALRNAYGLAKRVLIISTMAVGQESDSHTRAYRDGFVTKTNTFQKFYAPGELESLIEETLDAEPSTIGLGICVLFRNDEEAELFEAARNRRRIDWTEISAQLKFTAPSTREQRRVDKYELNKELFDQFWNVLLDLGRAPEPGEFDRLADLKRAGGGLSRALPLVVSRHGEEHFRAARKARMEDVLVYLAMSTFRKRFLRREIPLRIKNDIRAFFGDLPTAQARARELLYAAGDSGEIELACEGLDFGWQDVDSLTIHRTLLQRLPPILRIFVHCAAHRYGDPAQADLIKIHKHSGKITFQHYDDFDGKPLPELQTRIKVNLRNLFVEVFDHSRGPKIQLLYFKERFVPKAYPGRGAMERFSAKLRSLGLDEATIGFGPDKEAFRTLTLSKEFIDDSIGISA